MKLYFLIYIRSSQDYIFQEEKHVIPLQNGLFHNILNLNSICDIVIVQNNQKKSCVLCSQICMVLQNCMNILNFQYTVDEKTQFIRFQQTVYSKIYFKRGHGDSDLMCGCYQRRAAEESLRLHGRRKWRHCGQFHHQTR